MIRVKQNLPDYQHATKRIFPDLGTYKFEREFDIRGFLILHPFLQVATCEDNIVEKPPGLCDFSLEAWFVQVLGAGLGDLLFIVLGTAEKCQFLICLSSRMILLTTSRACGAGRDGTRHRGSFAPGRTSWQSRFALGCPQAKYIEDRGA